MMNLKPGDGPDASHGAGPNGADPAWIALHGVGPLAEGQQLKIAVGESIVIGRSRHCDWSLRRAPTFLKSNREERKAIRKDLAFNSVSRKHVRLTYKAPDELEIENLSGNGTLVDGREVTRAVLTDIRRETHVIRLGPEGVVLELAPGSLPL